MTTCNSNIYTHINAHVYIYSFTCEFVLCFTFHSLHITDLPLPDVLTHLQRASAVGAEADDDEFRGRGWELMPSGRLAHDRWYVRVCMCVCLSVLLCEEVVFLPLSAQCVVPLY